MTNSCAFSGEGPVLGQEDIFYDLLADGAAAFYGFTGLDVGQNGPADTDGVDGAMGIEAAVFGGDDGVLHRFRDGSDGHIDRDFFDLGVHG